MKKAVAEDKEIQRILDEDFIVLNLMVCCTTFQIRTQVKSKEYCQIFIPTPKDDFDLC